MDNGPGTKDTNKARRKRQGKEIAGESTPAYIFYLKAIDSMYPIVKKFCILRDPKDRVVSYFYNEKILNNCFKPLPAKISCLSSCLNLGAKYFISSRVVNLK